MAIVGTSETNTVYTGDSLEQQAAAARLFPRGNIALRLS